jgi:hypothetical protein
MSDSLGDARRALRQGEAGEALVHLWNALEQARGTNDSETLARVAALAQQVEEEGDEGERAEAERLLEEFRDAAELTVEEPDAEDEEWVLPAGETESRPRVEIPDEPADEVDEAAEVEEDEVPRSRGRAALGWLIPIAIFLFFTLRDVLS